MSDAGSDADRPIPLAGDDPQPAPPAVMPNGERIDLTEVDDIRGVGRRTGAEVGPDVTDLETPNQSELGRTGLDDPPPGTTGPPPVRPEHDGAPGRNAPPEVGAAAAGAFGGLRALPPFLAQRYPDARFVSQGSQAAVYRAEDSDHGAVAIRVANADVFDQADLSGILGVDNPNVARVHETGQEDHRTFQVLEWIDGTELSPASLGVARGPVPTAVAEVVLRQLHGALQAFEEIGQTHRDVKPSNVLVVPDPDSGSGGFRCVLIDFGLIHPAAHTIVAHPDRHFSPGYAAPEAFFGWSGLAYDWWSLGVVLAELIQGYHPFGRERDDVELNVFSLSADLSSITDPRWELLIRGLLTPDPRHRWRSREVAAWIAGGSPPVVIPNMYESLLLSRSAGAEISVPSEGPRAEATAHDVDRGLRSSTRPPVPPLVFLGRDYRQDPRRLADAFGTNWSDAARLLGSPAARGELLDWVGQFNDLELTAAVDEAGRPGSRLDRDLIRVIGALYRTQTTGSRGVGPRWYHGTQLHNHEVHRLVDEGLADVAELLPADPGGEPAGDEDEPVAGGTDAVATAGPSVRSEQLRRAVALVDGDLVSVARWCGRGTSTEVLAQNLVAGIRFLEQRTARLDDGEREDWELTLWRLRLLHALSDPAAGAALRRSARTAVRTRPDLWPLTGEGTGGAHHLVASILAVRTTPPPVWRRILLWLRSRRN